MTTGWLVLATTDETGRACADTLGSRAPLEVSAPDGLSLHEALCALQRQSVQSVFVVVDDAARLSEIALDRLSGALDSTGATLVYSDYHEMDEQGARRLRPLIGYQLGSVRDNFNFGALAIINLEAALTADDEALRDPLPAVAWYALRLHLSRCGQIVHLPEPCYTRSAQDHVRTGVKVFDYLRAEAQTLQRRFEEVCTGHLRAIDAWAPPPDAGPAPIEHDFPVRASVIIPVRDRVNTVIDAAKSALGQTTTFDMNVIVVDNHSTDGTTDALTQLSKDDARLIHVVPTRHDLGIGGCWDHAIRHAQCGLYAVQLDSDDLYSGDDVVQRIVDQLQQNDLAFLVGSYTTVDFDLEPLPPGLIDHREWTDENGHNNALRIAGLGAPRAFHVPTLRRIGFPNVSFGEDYALALTLSRQYRTGRIYDSLYWCRRWSGNTDSDLSVEQANRNDRYKDRLRTLEILARRAAN
ncbi:MAG: glycosyltransferase family 2 protein [Pseudomonadota bacterium]